MVFASVLRVSETLDRLRKLPTMPGPLLTGASFSARAGNGVTGKGDKVVGVTGIDSYPYTGLHKGDYRESQVEAYKKRTQRERSELCVILETLTTCII